MTKIVYIGAGSTAFARQFINGIIARPALAGSTLALVDVNPENLRLAERYARRAARQLGVPANVVTATDRRQVLEGADFVINTVLLYGPEVRVMAHQIAAKYGVDQAVGCSGGPGGVFRALKDIPFTLAIARDMEHLCPDAYYLDYSNPTSVTPMAVARATSVRYVGLCHSVPETVAQLAAYAGLPLEEVTDWVAGVNHQAWVLRFEHRGQDAYPRLREAMSDPAVYARDAVRFELLKFTGYFPTEASAHNSDFVPFFRRTPELMARYHLTDALPHWGAPGAAQQQAAAVAERRRRWQELALGEGPLTVAPEGDYCTAVMNGIVSGEPFRFNGRVLNTGLITNLPQGFCVDVPCLADRAGVHPCYVGELPPACAALNRLRVNADELALKAVLEQDRWAAEQAIALDPLTSSILSLPQIHEMVREIFANMGPYLWQDF